MEPDWEPVDTWHAGYDRWVGRLPQWSRLLLFPVDAAIFILAFLQVGWLTFTSSDPDP